MIARFQLCDRRQLELALADRLPTSQAEDLSSHLQHCEHCRADLERMAGEKEWWDDARSFLSSTDDIVAIDSSGAIQSSATATQHESHDEPGDDEMPLHFLSPPSRPGLLGQLGHYDIEEVIGRGGMGIVLKAQDTVLNRLVAIKVLAGHLAQSGAARKRFGREAQAAAAVVHDHVIPIHSVETSGETPFLVMPYVSGPLGPGGDAGDQRGAADRPADGSGAGGGSCAGTGAPGHQAGKHPAGKRGGAGSHHRLWPGPGGRRRQPDPERLHRGDAAVHGSRAGPRRVD